MKDMQLHEARGAAKRAQVDQPVRVRRTGVRGHGECQRGRDRRRDQHRQAFAHDSGPFPVVGVV